MPAQLAGEEEWSSSACRPMDSVVEWGAQAQKATTVGAQRLRSTKRLASSAEHRLRFERQDRTVDQDAHAAPFMYSAPPSLRS